MSESESESDWSETSAVVESDADRIRRNDKSLEKCVIDWNSDVVDILDALKHNTVVKNVTFYTACSVQLHQEALAKLSAVMKCNKSVVCLSISMETGLLRERSFAAMATSGGWSSIQGLQLFYDDTNIEPLSLREAEHISNFVIRCENLRSLSIDIEGDEAAPIVEILSRTDTKVQMLNIVLDGTLSIQNGVR